MYGAGDPAMSPAHLTRSRSPAAAFPWKRAGISRGGRVDRLVLGRYYQGLVKGRARRVRCRESCGMLYRIPSWISTSSVGEERDETSSRTNAGRSGVSTALTPRRIGEDHE